MANKKQMMILQYFLVAIALGMASFIYNKSTNNKAVANFSKSLCVKNVINKLWLSKAGKGDIKPLK